MSLLALQNCLGGTEVSVEWESEENAQKIKSRVAFVTHGCGCKMACLTTQCKCRKADLTLGQVLREVGTDIVRTKIYQN